MICWIHIYYKQIGCTMYFICNAYITKIHMFHLSKNSHIHNFSSALSFSSKFQYNEFFCNKLSSNSSYLHFNSKFDFFPHQTLGPNSPGPLTDDWKVTDDSSVNFHDKFFLHFLLKFRKNEEKTCHGNLWMSRP